ncbi:MAG: hypothetical protein J0H49_03335 [Acidobacteria bacterium]|nr:hypothetical protein [Acidobacteriota bacterium]
MKLKSLILCALCVWGVAAAQERPDPVSYRVDFQFRDVADKSSSAVRRYSLIVDPSGTGILRLGQRVPYATAVSQGGGGGSAPAVATQIQYADIGVNIDCRLRETGAKVTMTSNLEISTLIPAEKTAAASAQAPTVGSMRFAVGAALTLGKSTTIASIDDPVTQRKFDLDATVTKLN